MKAEIKIYQMVKNYKDGKRYEFSVLDGIIMPIVKFESLERTCSRLLGNSKLMSNAEIDRECNLSIVPVLNYGKLEALRNELMSSKKGEVVITHQEN